MIFLQVLGLLLLLVAALPTLVLGVEVLAASFNRHAAARVVAPGPMPRTQILVPAHNESNGIVAALRQLAAHLPDNTEVLVIADNCSDNTADLVRAFQTEHPQFRVVERSHETQRGKGYALDFGVKQLASNAPEIVMVVDADCLVYAGTLQTLALQCQARNRPAQALYLMTTPPDASPKSKVAEFAWLVKNKVRPLGLHLLGLPCQLMGTGMAFTWQQITATPLASGEIVEDLKMGLDLAKLGFAPVFCPQAFVSSTFPDSDKAIADQRSRWEHGHMAMILKTIPWLSAHAMRRANGQLAALGLDLTVPPVVALLMFDSLLALAGGAATWVWGFTLLSWLLAPVLVLLTALMLAWIVFGRDVLSFKHVLSIPVYLLSKLPIYFNFVFNRQVKWNRAKRGNE